MEKVRSAIAEALAGVPDRHVLAERIVDALGDAGYVVVENEWVNDVYALLGALEEMPERRTFAP